MERSVLRKTGRISCAQLSQDLEGMVEFSFGGWFMGLGLGFGFGSRMSTCSAGKLCTVVAHKLSMCCAWFEFVFGMWNMHFDLCVGLVLVFGVRFGFWVGFAFGVWLGFVCRAGRGSVAAKNLAHQLRTSFTMPYDYG